MELKENLEVLEKLLECIKAGKSVALCTIVDKIGSTPRDVGAKMLVFEDKSSFGTIGGGRFEELLIEDAVKALKEGNSKIISYSFSPLTKPESVVTNQLCGGEAKVFIDVIKPIPRLIIIGSGDIAQALVKIASILKFEIFVISSKKAQLSEVLSKVENLILEEDFDEALNRMINLARHCDYIAIVHGDLEEDYKALKVALKSKARYIGLLGGKLKVSTFIKRLKDDGFKSDEFANRLYAPIGLDIDSDTPEEIALSIITEILKLKKEKREVIDHLSLVKQFLE